MPSRVVMPVLMTWLKKGAELVAIGSLSAMFGVFLLQVFSRYVLNAPIGWTVEACVILYIWTVFWSAAFLLREQDHVAFTMILDAVAPPTKRLMLLVGTTLIGVGMAASIPAVVDYITFMKIDKTPVIGIRFDLVYSVYILFVVAVVIRSVLTILKLVGPNWRRVTSGATQHRPTGDR